MPAVEHCKAEEYAQQKGREYFICKSAQFFIRVNPHFFPMCGATPKGAEARMAMFPPYIKLMKV